MQQTFFGKNDGKDALSSPSRSNHVDVMRWVDCLRMFLGLYLQSYVFRRILKDMFWWSLSTKFAQRKNKQALAGYTYIYVYFVPSTSLGTMSRSKKKSCGNALGLNYPHWSTKRNRAIMLYGLSCVPGAGFSQQHVHLYFYMQNEKQNPKCFISQPILSIRDILATNQETSQHKRVMNQGYLKKT